VLFHAQGCVVLVVDVVVRKEKRMDVAFVTMMNSSSGAALRITSSSTLTSTTQCPPELQRSYGERFFRAFLASKTQHPQKVVSKYSCYLGAGHSH